ncbi:MAG: tetratricopeptide repeat protein, partial [Candidatus Brocadia sp.]
SPRQLPSFPCLLTPSFWYRWTLTLPWDAYNLYRMGKMDQSLELLKKVIAIDPEHAEAHFGMGSIYFRQNMFDDAVREFTEVTRIKPEYALAYERLWLAYKKLGMNDKAEESLQAYRKIMLERMEALSGRPPQVVKPVTPPTEEKKAELRTPQTRVETSQPNGNQITSNNCSRNKGYRIQASRNRTQSGKAFCGKTCDTQAGRDRESVS